MVVIARLDTGGPLHRNPDGSELPCPHLHLYRAGFGDKWAFPIPTDWPTNLSTQLILEYFLRYCNVIRPPEFQFDLSS